MHPQRRNSLTASDFQFLRHASHVAEMHDDHGFDDDNFYNEVECFNNDMDLFSHESDPYGSGHDSSSVDTTGSLPPSQGAGGDVTPPKAPERKKDAAASISGLNFRVKAKKFLSKNSQSKLLGGHHNSGLVWHAQAVCNDYFDLKNCTQEGQLKQRRPVPIIRASQFFADLEYTGGKWIHRAPLNGWPGLTDLEVVSITGKVKSMANFRIRRYWNNDTDQGTRPSFPENLRSCRITLAAPKFSLDGWTPDSPGHVWWFNQFNETCFHGKNIIDNFRSLEAKEGIIEATQVHHFAHRYAKAKEGVKDRVVYHSAILLEWSHAKHCTVFELAFLNGNFPAYMIAPWNSSLAELRIVDVPYKNWDEFSVYLADHEGPKGKSDHRFFDVTKIGSAPVTLACKTAPSIATYLCNYIRHNREYHEESRNCQTFAADWYRLLSGDTHVKPFHPLCQILYHHHEEWFMYDPPEEK
ncbi:hypothetical protein TL16_g08759 [Triparma laevis f. inornata]|uniref:Uncharacterized protein n=1 Tax=Triparma laevis f. inornata TaxID=1714386 RepID=A0A9W7B2L5_9STRA|nr:hypothetical protein TL16_g08759 [Triparma laevis f. inornata]